jgi:hypothetical protein
MTLTPLTPCPFCGGAAVFVSHAYVGMGASGMEFPDWSVECSKCKVSTPRQCGEKWVRGKGTLSLEVEAKRALAGRWNTRKDATHAQAFPPASQERQR